MRGHLVGPSKACLLALSFLVVATVPALSPVQAGTSDVSGLYVATLVRPYIPVVDDAIDDVDGPIIWCRVVCPPSLPFSPWDYATRDWISCPESPMGLVASDYHSNYNGFPQISVEIKDSIYSRTYVQLCVYEDGDYVPGGSGAGVNGASVALSGDYAELWVFALFIVPGEPEQVYMGSTGTATYTYT